ncbi:MAG: septum site-determining protein MinC [Desulforhopalus sp.]
MTSLSKKKTTKKSAAALKGRMISLTVLELYSSDLGDLNQKLREKAHQAPAFFRNAPVMLDFENLEEEVDMAWLDSAHRLLTGHNFVPVGITRAPTSLEYAARAEGIAIWPSSGTESHPPKDKTPEPEKVQEIEAPPPAQPLTKVLHQPVRSGQKVYAQGGDLIVLASVSAGAEILADGHIHIYGTLRGRALAGVQGDENARIFCHDLQADLVAIAGYYIINDDLPADKRNTAVQIFLDQEHLYIESL